MDGEDRHLGLNRPISRRDVLNGVVMGLGGSLASAWLTACGRSLETAALFAQDRPTYYPPALTGMRGSHDGSWELAHALRDGTFWQQAGAVTDTRETYDLVVVGGGISGLAAYFFRQQAGNNARILLLDNHDDFGGHATRNEFSAGGELLLGNGGTHAIATPTPYSSQARGLLTALGIDPPTLTAQCVDQQLFAALKPAVFFNKQTFGEERLVARDPARPWAEFLARTPLSPAAQRDIERIQEARIDYLPGLSSHAKKDRLSRLSYHDFLLHIVQAHPDVIPFYQARTHGLYGVGIDAVPASIAGGWATRLPGPGSRARPGAAHEPHRGGCGYTEARAVSLPLPGRQRLDCAPPRARARAGGGARAHGRRHRHHADQLCTAGSAWRRSADQAGQSRSTSAAGGRSGSSREVVVYYARARRVYAVRGRGASWPAGT